jgi:hypothetical protein
MLSEVSTVAPDAEAEAESGASALAMLSEVSTVAPESAQLQQAEAERDVRSAADADVDFPTGLLCPRMLSPAFRQETEQDV